MWAKGRRGQGLAERDCGESELAHLCRELLEVQAEPR